MISDLWQFTLTLLTCAYRRNPDSSIQHSSDHALPPAYHQHRLTYASWKVARLVRSTVCANRPAVATMDHFDVALVPILPWHMKRLEWCREEISIAPCTTVLELTGGHCYFLVFGSTVLLLTLISILYSGASARSIITRFGLHKSIVWLYSTCHTCIVNHL
jgi:hypothetical protein